MFKRADMQRKSIALRMGIPCVFILGMVSGCSKEEAAAPPPKLVVSVMTVEPRDVPVNYEFVGETHGWIDAEVRARVDGVIESMHFTEGSEVKTGQLLYVLDPAPFKAQVAEAKAKKAEAETMLVKATVDLKRIKPLAAIHAVSARDLDAAVANEGVARSSVEAGQASVEAAEIKLGYTRISAPVDGVIGISKAKVGELVGIAPNPVILNTVSQLDPIKVRFTVNEREFLYFSRLRSKNAKDGNADAKRELTMVLADGSEHSFKGEISSIDQKIDASTGSLPVEAVFPNPDKVLRAGLFAKVRSMGELKKGALTVPNVAVRDLQGQTSVFVVDSSGMVESRTVKLGVPYENSRVVEEGLKQGDVVAIDNLQRIKPGSEVTVKR